MSFIHVQFAPDFRREDVVLLAMDTAGVVEFRTALTEALHRGSSQLVHGELTHKFRIQAGAADIELGEKEVVWLLDHETAVEIDEDLAEFSGHDRSGHQYVDIHSPTETLVLSNNEYTPEYFEQLPDELRNAKPGEISD